MGPSRTYRVYRTHDLDDALAKARRLRDLLRFREEEVVVDGTVTRVDALQRVRGPAATALFSMVRPPDSRGVHLWESELPHSQPELRRLLPLEFSAGIPDGPQVDELAHALGRCPGSLRWIGLWPDEPELDAYGDPGYDAVEVAVNAEVPLATTAAPGVHTLHVRVAQHGHLGCARRLAALVGGAVAQEHAWGR
ncbi:hypothetical protein ABT160_13885 [Streptomyces sp. NPDC001941]|uniref:hypothetical protein n=1 Tax=Streptomyces sp. NPDC001941 TaxID=3154659 RepID=UPI003316D45C